MREKVNEHFIASKHNLDSDDIDLLMNSELVHGSKDDYDDLILLFDTMTYLIMKIII